MAKNNIDLAELTEHSRYSFNLNELGKSLGIKEILYLDFSSDYQGHVNIEALLNDGRVWAYSYSYGSCSGCDNWEAEYLTDTEIEFEMAKESTFFDNMDQYQIYLKGVQR